MRICISPFRAVIWHKNRFSSLPVLAECGNGVWALYAEAAVFGDTAEARCSLTKKKPELLMVRRAPDQLSPHADRIPRRHALARGDVRQPDDIVSSNLLENLNPP